MNTPTSSGFDLSAEMHCRLGNQLLLQGKRVDAESEFRKAIQVQPDADQAYNNLGILYMQMKRVQEAEAMLLTALRINPGNPAGAANLGRVLIAQGQYEQAVYWLRVALSNKPQAGSPAWWQLNARFAETACQLALALQNLDRFAEAQEALHDAETSCREALELDRNRADGWVALGTVHMAQDRHADAETCYRQASLLQPESLSLENLVGKSLREQGKLAEAVGVFSGIIALHPRLAETHADIGLALAALGRYSEALQHYDTAVAIQPDEVVFRWNRALALLAAGNYAPGWKDYGLRFELPETVFPSYKQPMWDGSPLEGRTLLLRAEQGIGDTLQYVRFAPHLPKNTGRVIVECRPVLTEILRSCPGIDEVVPEGSSPPHFDLYAPLMSLPHILGTTLASVPDRVPYLFPPAERIMYWRSRLQQDQPGLCVGIVWQGSWKGRRRSCSLSCFAPLSKVPGIRLISLQKGPGTDQLAGANAAGMDVLDLGSVTSPSFADTAALITCLDLVISIDTSIVHLAGALGMPTWVALANPADWLWMHGREDSPWYPSLRLFRQPAPREWGAVFARMAEELKGFVPRRKIVRT